MKPMKKVFLSILILTAAVLICCGCSVSKDQSSSTESASISSVDDLSGKRIGVQLGTTGDLYCTDYEKDGSGTVVERYNKGADAIQALRQGKIDCVVIDELTKEDYAFVLSKDNTTLLDQINQALDELKADGTIDNIEKNWVGAESELGKYPYEKKDIDRSNGTITIGTNAEFPPYESYSDGQIVGIDIDIMQAVCDKLGMDLQIEDMAFDSIITAVTSGKVDVGASGFTITEERKKNVNFTDSYTTSKQVIIVKDTSVQNSRLSFVDKLKQSFIDNDNYQYLLKGLGNTLLITFFAVIIGILIGFLIAIVRTSHDRNGSLPLLNGICRLYLTIIRGTPVMVQLLIIYYVILANINTSKILVAVVAFGLNSAAYVAEIVRSGIMAVDIGQFEAGRSLGLNYNQTMRSIILPQAVKNILPALCNEFISLLKETSISGYIGLMDLTKGGDIIRSTTFQAMIPLISVAIIYLVMVVGLSKIVGILERKLRNNER